MKTDYENEVIENMISLFNEANKIAGLNCEMVHRTRQMGVKKGDSG